MASSGGKRTLSERLRECCRTMICYCSLANKSSLTDPGDVPPSTLSTPPHPDQPPATTDRKGSADSSRKGSVDSHRKGSADSSRKGSVDSHRKGSADSQMTDHTTSTSTRDLNESGSSNTFSPRRKSVKFQDQQDPDERSREHSVGSEDDLAPLPQSSSPWSPPGKRPSLTTQSTVESQMEELPAELRSLEAKLTALFGNGFFKTVEEGGSEEQEDGYEVQREDSEWAHLDTKIQISEQQLRAKISEVEDMAENLRLAIKQKLTSGFFPFEFELTQFDSLKRRKAAYSSPPMYTHPGGYRFRLEVLPAGEGMAEGTHLSINAVSLKGDFDAILAFPTAFTVTIQILNTHVDTGHFTREIECHYCKNGSNSTHEIGSEFEFILLKKLYWNEEKQTLYLKNEKIRFRVTRILFISEK